MFSRTWAQGQVEGLELQVQGPKAREQGPEFQKD